jgi:hypothetical protein
MHILTLISVTQKDVTAVTPRFSECGGKEPRTLTHKVLVAVLHPLCFHSSSHYRLGGEGEITDIYSYRQSDCRCSFQVWLLCRMKYGDPSSSERFRRTGWGALGKTTLLRLVMWGGIWLHECSRLLFFTNGSKYKHFWILDSHRVRV